MDTMRIEDKGNDQYYLSLVLVRDDSTTPSTMYSGSTSDHRGALGRARISMPICKANRKFYATNKHEAPNLKV